MSVLPGPPQLPFDTGSPEKAGEELSALARKGCQELNSETVAIAEKLASNG